MSPAQESSTPTGKHQRSGSNSTDSEPAQKRMAGLPDISTNKPSQFGNLWASPAQHKGLAGFMADGRSVNKFPSLVPPMFGMNAESQPNKDAYMVELPTDSCQVSSSEPFKKTLKLPSELIALMLNHEKSGTYTASKETYRLVFEALLHAVQGTEHSANYEKVLGPKVFQASEERVSLARALVQVAERCTDAMRPSNISEKAQEDLQDASRFLKKQEAYRDMMQGVLRQFSLDKESLTRELEAKLRNDYGYNDISVRLHWGKLNDLLENARSRVKTGTQRVKRELEHDISVANVAKELLAACDGGGHSEQKSGGETSQVNIQSIIESIKKDV